MKERKSINNLSTFYIPVLVLKLARPEKR